MSDRQENSIARIKRIAREREEECRRIVEQAKDEYHGCSFDIWRGKMKPPKAREKDKP